MRTDGPTRISAFDSVSLCLVLAASLTLLVGCGTAQHPASALDEYVSAVRSRDAGAVYGMIGDDLRGEMSASEFKTFFSENYEEIAAQAEAIERSVDRGELEISAGVPVDEHAEIVLQYGDSDWVLADDVPAIAGASSPKGTLAALSAAIQANDLDAYVALLARQKAEILQAELRLIGAGLAAVDENDIIINGERATVYLDWGLKVELVFEDGAWRLDNFPEQE